MSGQKLDEQIYPESPGEVWKLGGLSGHKAFVIALVIVKNRCEPTIVVTLDAVGYPEAVPGKGRSGRSQNTTAGGGSRDRANRPDR